MKIVGRFTAFPLWAKVTGIAAGSAIVLAAVSIPVAALAVDERNRAVALELEAKKEAAAEQEAAEALAEVKGEAARLNAGFDGLTSSLGAVVHPDAAAAFEGARVKLAFAIADGERVDEVATAVDAVTGALDGLAESVALQAEALIAASPLAGGSRTSLTAAVAELDSSGDLVAALSRVKAASDAVIAAQKAGKAAADAAAAKRRAEEAADAGSWGADAPSGDSSGGGHSTEHPYDPGITGMQPGERGSCGESPNGQVVTMSFRWQAREGNTVDIYYALTDGDYQATSGFSQIVSGGGESGSVDIPVTCPVGSGPYTYITVKAVASNPNGSAAAFFWGL